MFQASKKRLQRLLDVVDDMLVGAPEEAFEDAAPHPHTRRVMLRVERRAGTVPLRPAHCLSPIERPAARRRDRDAVR
ncbi:MAG TPA: hypothetical protein VKV21_09125 [Solirubrobacteraceae bacterium]|nr:hypothetical protein [Solirubrobacteraceae bacterium]